MLACKRYLDWFNDPTKYFDADKIQRIEDFLQHISHFEGEFNGLRSLIRYLIGSSGVYVTFSGGTAQTTILSA